MQTKVKTVGFPGKYWAPWGPRFFELLVQVHMYRNKRLGCQMGCARTKILTASDCINVALQSENMTSVDVADLLEELTSTLGALKESIICGSMSESTY